MQIINPNLKFTSPLSKRKTTTAIVLHHAAADWSIERIHNSHINANGWSGIGYNFYIRKDGKIYQGRGWDIIGAHAGTTSGYNSKSIGICFEGKYHSTDRVMPDAQYLAGVRLIGEALRRYGKLDILRHSDVSVTGCPGKYFPFVKMKEDGEDEIMTDTKFAELMAAYQANQAKAAESAWSVKEGHWKKATAAKIFDGTAPQGNMTREQTAAVLGRLGLI